MLYQWVCAPFRNRTFSRRSGSESIYLLKSSTVISCSHISRTTSCSSSKVHPPYGLRFLSLCFKILHTFSIGFRSGEQGSQSIEYIKHSTRTLLQRPWFPFVSFFPCTLLPSSTTKYLSPVQKSPIYQPFFSIQISPKRPRKIYFSYFFCINPFPSPSVDKTTSLLLKLYPITAAQCINVRPL